MIQVATQRLEDVTGADVNAFAEAFDVEPKDVLLTPEGEYTILSCEFEAALAYYDPIDFEVRR